MSDKAAKESQNTSEQTSVDLNSLSEFGLGPSWVTTDNVGKRERKSSKAHGEKKPLSDKTGDSSRHSRISNRRGKDRVAPNERGRKRAHHSSRDKRNGDAFEFAVEVALYPQDQAFDALINRLRTTSRTYQLFEIARLLLEKPDRFVVVVTKKPKKEDEEATSVQDLLYYSVPKHLPFSNEAEAINHVLNNHLDLFFDIEEVEVDPLKVNFQMINKCGITGELLGPPNYHRYREFLQRHYNKRIQGISYERFLSKIESTRESEHIDLWVESMRKSHRYRLKETVEGEPEVFESFDSVRYFLLQHRKDQMVGSERLIRFKGCDIKHLPKDDIHRSVEQYLEQQRHFPLDTANNIRGRLRRHNFTVYKKGSNGVSFVCAVKRKFRDAETVFTDSIKELILFLEKNPEILASKLPKMYLNLNEEKQIPEKLNIVDLPTSEKSGSSDVQAIVDSTVEAASDAESCVNQRTAFSEEDQGRLNQLMIDLRWLVSEGYVTEYGDGRLFVWPLISEPKKKEPKAEALGEVVSENQSVAVDDVTFKVRVGKEKERSDDDILAS